MEVLLGPEASRVNKFALVAQYRLEGRVVHYRWGGRPFRSRLWFLFPPDDSWYRAKSYEEDVVPLLDFDRRTV